MKKILLSCALCSLVIRANAQQISNSNFEQWETSTSETAEPVNWNSFKSASGPWASFSSKQLEKSTSVRPGSAGIASAYIFSKDILGTIANGNLTVGKINMGSSTATDPSNYNTTITSDGNFSEAITGSPDSLVFWTKFSPILATDSARVSCIIHDNYAFKDPIDAGSQSHIVDLAIQHFATTNGQWMRISVPFSHTGPANTPAFVLITFTTNKVPGGGSGNDQLWIDDLELIYNATNSLNEVSNSSLSARVVNHELNIHNPGNENGTYEVLNLSGQILFKGNLAQTYTFNETGLFVVRFRSDKGIFTQKVLNN